MHKTVELASVIAVVEKELGFPASRVRSVARRLSEAKILPAGAPGVSPMLDFRDLGTLLLGLAADASIPDTPDAVLVLDKLVPEGIDPAEFPEPVKSRMSRAGHVLDALIADAMQNEDALRRVRIEVVSSWPEIAIYWTEGKAERFREPGKDPNFWAAGHRRATQIDGKALFYAVRDLFADKQADAA